MQESLQLFDLGRLRRAVAGDTHLLPSNHEAVGLCAREVLVAFDRAVVLSNGEVHLDTNPLTLLEARLADEAHRAFTLLGLHLDPRADLHPTLTGSSSSNA